MSMPYASPAHGVPTPISAGSGGHSGATSPMHGSVAASFAAAQDAPSTTGTTVQIKLAGAPGVPPGAQVKIGSQTHSLPTSASITEGQTVPVQFFAIVGTEGSPSVVGRAQVSVGSDGSVTLQNVQARNGYHVEYNSNLKEIGLFYIAAPENGGAPAQPPSGIVSDWDYLKKQWWFWVAVVGGFVVLILLIWFLAWLFSPKKQTPTMASLPAAALLSQERTM